MQLLSFSQTFPLQSHGKGNKCNDQQAQACPGKTAISPVPYQLVGREGRWIEKMVLGLWPFMVTHPNHCGSFESDWQGLQLFLLNGKEEKQIEAFQSLHAYMGV